MTSNEAADREAIADVVRTFFAAFTSGSDVLTRLDRLREVFLPGAVIVRTCGAEPLLYDVDGFIAPRAELLTSGGLVNFREWELDGRTDLYGDVASRVCTYAKSWQQDGQSFSGRGFKSLQLVRSAEGWRISAVAWDDERDGARP